MKRVVQVNVSPSVPRHDLDANIERSSEETNVSEVGALAVRHYFSLVDDAKECRDGRLILGSRCLGRGSTFWLKMDQTNLDRRNLPRRNDEPRLR